MISKSKKPTTLTVISWPNLIKKAITYIQMAVLDEIFVKDCNTGYKVWEELRATY